jgi:hypothetical protein
LGVSSLMPLISLLKTESLPCFMRVCGYVLFGQLTLLFDISLYLDCLVVSVSLLWRTCFFVVRL